MHTQVLGCKHRPIPNIQPNADIFIIYICGSEKYAIQKYVSQLPKANLLQFSYLSTVYRPGDSILQGNLKLIN